MKIFVNGEAREVRDGLMLTELLEQLGLTSGRIAVERNRDVVMRAAHAATRLEADDKLEIVHFVGGG